MGIRWTEPTAVTAGERKLVRFDILLDDASFECVIPFDVLERDASEAGRILDSAEDHLEYTREVQPRLKDIALHKFWAAAPIQRAANDL